MKYGYNSGGIYKVSLMNPKRPTPAYSRWNTMMQRCYNPTHKAYSTYGGAGVKVVEHWHDFQNFAQWYEARCVEGWVMDKDCSGGVGYGPDSVIFVPEQVNQHLKCFSNGASKPRKQKKGWAIKTTDIDNNSLWFGGFDSEESASEFYQSFIREKMKSLVEKFQIPPETADRLLAF